MAPPLLTTKLYIPPTRNKLVQRNRLLELLDTCLDCKLVLISAPAGFGKTTLLSQWIANKVRPVGWLTLDAGDNDLARFLVYFLAALMNTNHNTGISIDELLNSPQPLNTEAILTGIINEIADVAEPFLVVLDDYHLITEPEVHEAIIFIIENMPPQMRLVISSRVNPPWPLARMRGRAEILELRTNDLRFTPGEVAVFFNEIMGLDLTTDDIASLEARTEGWIAGLQMAAISMQGREDLTAFVQAFSGSHRFILDYLLEEVLNLQSPNIQNFLLKTSILERMTARLCDVVIDSNDSQNILTQLDRANLFLIPMDDERCWYRYHHLFSDLLKNQLTQIYPDELQDMHRRASQWYEEQDLRDEAINHAFAAGDDKRVARLVQKYAMDMLHQSKYTLLLSWIEALPESLVEQDPWLCVYLSWTRHWAGRREGGEKCLDNAERYINTTSTFTEIDAKALVGYIATVRAHYALINQDIPRVLEQSQIALQQLPEDDYFTRGSAGIALGGAYWGMGDVSRSEQAFLDCASSALKGGYNYRASSAFCYAGMQQVKQARLYHAEETFQKALALAQDSGGRRYPNAGYPLAKLAELACEWNNLSQARLYADEGVILCTQLGHVDLIAEAFAALARVQLAQKDYQGVQETLNRTDTLSRHTPLDPWALSWLDESRVRFWLSNGRIDEALEWIKISGLSEDDEFNYHHDLHHITLARVLVARLLVNPSIKLQDETLPLLGRLLAATNRAGWVHQKISILILQALAHHACDDGSTSLAALEHALKLAEPGGYIRSFIGEGSTVIDLLQMINSIKDGDVYIRMLIAAQTMEEMSPTHEADSPSSLSQQKGLLEQLSDRELQVLRLLNSSLSAAEIADELYIAVSTTRTHIKSIYQKLDVHSRLEAVERARDLGLI